MSAFSKETNSRAYGHLSTDLPRVVGGGIAIGVVIEIEPELSRNLRGAGEIAPDEEDVLCVIGYAGRGIAACLRRIGADIANQGGPVGRGRIRAGGALADVGQVQEIVRPWLIGSVRAYHGRIRLAWRPLAGSGDLEAAAGRHL